MPTVCKELGKGNTYYNLLAKKINQECDSHVAHTSKACADEDEQLNKADISFNSIGEHDDNFVNMSISSCSSSHSSEHE